MIYFISMMYLFICLYILCLDEKYLVSEKYIGHVKVKKKLLRRNHFERQMKVGEIRLCQGYD